jgi:hypothetical protein
VPHSQHQQPPETGNLLEERLSVLRRTVHALSSEMLAALASGLDKHGDELIAGRLFSSSSGGGCAVGVMLQELDPDRFAHRGLRFWLRDRWRRGSRSFRGPMSRNPRLMHLEWIFDDAARLLRSRHPDLSPAAAAVVAGRWVRRAVERELRWRELREAFAAASAPLQDRPLAGAEGPALATWIQG